MKLTTAVALDEVGPSKAVMIGQVALGAVLGILLAWLLSACDPEPPLPATAVDAEPYAISLGNCADRYRTASAMNACNMRVWQDCEEKYHPCPAKQPPPLDK